MWRRAGSPALLGEGPVHHPDGAPGPGQRVLRDRGVRARALAPPAARGARRGGSAGRPAGAQPTRPHRRLHRGVSGRDHDVLDRHRRARRARHRSPAGAAVRARDRPHGGGGDLGDRRLPADHRHAERRRRDRAEALRDPARRGRRAADRRPAPVLPHAVQPVHHRAQRLVVLDPADARDRPRGRARGRHTRRPQARSSPSPRPAGSSTSARRTCSPASSTSTNRRHAR